MKSVYWRPQKVSRQRLLMVAGFAIVGLTLVQQFPTVAPPALVNGRWDAVHLAQAMFDAIRDERIERGIISRHPLDPTHSGLIGSSQSIVTSRVGDLRSKQTTANPNFAAAVVQMLWNSGARPGDTVAIGWSGSYPAWNVAVTAAVEALRLQPVIIASGTSSQYGANDPELMWLDMESTLRQKGLTSCRSAAVSIGAGGDRGLGLAPSGQEAVRAAAERNHIETLTIKSLASSIDQRDLLYRELAVDQPIRAYINVGGGLASTGGERAEELFRPGLNVQLDPEQPKVDCVMSRMLTAGVPVIHLRHAKPLASQWGLPIAPEQAPTLGTGKAFEAKSLNRWLALSVIVIVLTVIQFTVLRPGEFWLTRRLAKLLRWTPAIAAGDANDTREPQLMV